jgi:hypothetical protein
MLDRAIGIVGISLALIFGLWSLAPETSPKPPTWAFLLGIWFGALLIGLAIGLLIGDRRRLLRPEAPDFRLSIEGANVFDSDATDMRDRYSGIALNVTIWNTGAASRAMDWNLFVVPQGIEPVLAQFAQIPEVLRLGGQYNSVVIRRSEALDLKTKNTPLETAPVEGVLLFYVPLKKEMVQAPTTRWELVVKDMYGKESKVTRLIGDWAQR